MLSIGTFSKISGVTAHTLRYYDEIGLLRPARVNEENGYRYYAVAQLQTVLLIQKLKGYQLSLEEIAEILRDPRDLQPLLFIMKQKRREMEQTRRRIGDTLRAMDLDVSNLERGIHIMSYIDKIKVELVQTQPQNIAFIRKMMSTKDFGTYLSQLYHTIEAAKWTIVGAPMAIFHIEEEFNPDCYDNEIAIPVREEGEGIRLLPGGPCAKATLEGPYTELPAVYTKLQQWVEQEGYTPVSEAYEVYQTDPGQTAPEENRTEIYLPVEKAK